MASDWIRLHRKALDSRVFSDDWLWRLWCWCLLKAAWKESWKDGRSLAPGQFATDCRGAAENLGTSPSKVYRGLHTLRQWGQIDMEAKRSFTVVTICNWKAYQIDDREERNAGETQVKHRRNAGETQNEVAESAYLFVDYGIASENGEKMGLPPSSPLSPPRSPSIPSPPPEEGKKGKKRASAPAPFRKPTLEEITAYCRERGNRVSPQAFLDHYESNGWRVGRTPMRDWRAAVRTWEKREAEFRPRGQDAPAGPKETPAERTDRIRREAEASRQVADPDAVKQFLSTRGRTPQNPATEKA